MAVAKAISANDVIEGCSVGLPRNGDLASVIYDNTARTVHVSDPTASDVAKSLNGRFAGGEWNNDRPVNLAATTDRASGTTGGEISLTYAASPFQRHALYGVAYSYNGETNGSGVLKIEAGSGNVVFQETIPAKGVGSFQFEKGLRTSANVDMIVRLGAVTGLIASVSAMGHRME